MSEFLSLSFMVIVSMYPVIIFIFMANDYEILDAFLWPILILKRVKEIWYE